MSPAPPGINDICNSQQHIHDLDPNGRRSKRRNNIDWNWLQACLGVVEGDSRCVEAYLRGGGNPSRALTAHEVALLDRASAFDPGHTLIHLAIRFQRQEILTTLLSRISEIEELPAPIQDQLFMELLDKEAQQTLEADPPLINWSGELTLTLGSRLYALWNRSAGDCLLDAVCQAALYSRWAGWERWVASQLQYAPEEAQLRAEWGRLVAAAARPGTALHQVSNDQLFVQYKKKRLHK
ncbi:unnamed protein product, partial [Leptidea sinapis]